MAYSDYYPACQDALQALFTGTPVGTDEIVGWLETHRPVVVARLLDAGYRQRDDGGGTGWTWRQYLANVLARMAVEGLVVRQGASEVVPAGYATPVATWVPGERLAEQRCEGDRRALTVRLPASIYDALRRTSEQRGVSMQCVVEELVSNNIDDPAPASEHGGVPFQQLDLLDSGKKCTAPYDPRSWAPSLPALRTVGLFAGIGGIEAGLSRAGHETSLLCEIDDGAVAVLAERFPGIEVARDVRELAEFPSGTDLVAGGFPCQDLSQAGMTRGISGARSGLVGEVFRLLQERRVPWLALENVPFMLQLARGEALEVIVTMFEHLGYKWAYRVVDTRAFGIPQRRQRVLMLASLDADPREVLLVDDVGEPEETSKERWRERACGFYWTEGVRGLGWAHDAVPTLKGGSTVGVPSPPAIVLRSGRIVKPDLRDCERLQGFPADWTLPAEQVMRKGYRWKLVGNAVTVDVFEWLGKRLRAPGSYDTTGDVPLNRSGAWPTAGYNVDGRRWTAAVSTWPTALPAPPLEEFLQFDPEPLSTRATAGFQERMKRGSLRFPPGFPEIIEAHLRWTLDQQREVS